jgi:hypothetical protein
MLSNYFGSVSLLVSTSCLGAVYTCDLAYESAYDSEYDLLPKVSRSWIL